MPIQRFISFVAIPQTRARGAWVERAQKLLEPGDILVCYSRFHLSNLFIPGFYNHAAIYVGDGYLVEALPESGVRATSIIEWIMKKDAIALMRPQQVAFWDRLSAAKAALSFIGGRYDRGFTVGGKKFFCSEVIYRAYLHTPWVYVFTKRDLFGVLTVTPQDFRDASGKTALLFEAGVKGAKCGRG